MKFVWHIIFSNHFIRIFCRRLGLPRALVYDFVRSVSFVSPDSFEQQLKLFINVNDISDDHGPFRFINAQLLKKIIGQFRHGKCRFTDAEIAATGNDLPTIILTGARGEGGCVDTSRCLHFGSRANRYDRLVLMAPFLKYGAPLLKVSIPVLDRPESYR